MEEDLESLQTQVRCQSGLKRKAEVDLAGVKKELADAAAALEAATAREALAAERARTLEL